MRRILTLEEASAIQAALNTKANARLEEDGHFGALSQQALMRFQAEHDISPADGNPSQPTLDALGIPDLFVAPVAPASKPSIFNQIGTILSLIALLKGKPMTTDQIGGLVRAILTFLAGLAVARGWIDNTTALTIVGALVTILTAGWSVFTNRPSKIVGKS